MKTTLPSPAELGMPEKFTGWRPNQEQALHFLLNSSKRVKALCAPTGSGKSADVVGYALSTGQPTCIVTDNRALQDQYCEEFKSIGMVDLRGRRNYQCIMRDDPDYTCETGYQARCPHKGTVACPSSQAEMRAATSSLVVTNYSKWIAAKRYGTGMNHFTQVVFDEGHEAPNALAAAMQVIINQRETEEHIRMDWPAGSAAEDFRAWKLWAQLARPGIELKWKAAEEAVRRESDPSPGRVRHCLHMRNLTRRLAVLATARAEDWVVEELERAYQFDPVSPGRYAESTLLLKVPNIVVVSATLRPKTMFLMGVAQENFDFKELPSDFPRSRCPIYWIPTMRVDSRVPDLSMLWVRLDQIAARRRDRNGLVHTISYNRRDEVVKRSRFAGSMLVNERGEPPTSMVEVFKESYPGAILVSPSIGQGFDFAYKAAEWQFVTKVPFPPPSKILKARTERDREYPYYLAMQDFVQICGRLMRYPDDQGETFIADDHFGEWFMPRYGHLAPKSFHGFYRRVDVLPQPPSPLP